MARNILYSGSIMNKIKIVLGLVLGILVLGNVAGAEDRLKIEDKLKISDRPKQIMVKQAEEHKNNFARYGSNLNERVEKMFANQEEFLNRANKLLNRRVENGAVVTEEIKTALANAQKTLDASKISARATLAELKALLDKTSNDKLTPELREKVKPLLKNITEGLSASHRAILELIKVVAGLPKTINQ